MIHPRCGKLLHVPPFTQRQRLKRDHVVLMLRGIVRRGGVCGRVYHAQHRDFRRRWRWQGGRRCGSGGKESGEFVVGEQERVGARGVRVKVDYVEAREVARKEDIERICRRVGPN